RLPAAVGATDRLPDIEARNAEPAAVHLQEAERRSGDGDEDDGEDQSAARDHRGNPIPRCKAYKSATEAREHRRRGHPALAAAACFLLPPGNGRPSRRREESTVMKFASAAL